MQNQGNNLLVWWDGAKPCKCQWLTAQLFENSRTVCFIVKNCRRGEANAVIHPFWRIWRIFSRLSRQKRLWLCSWESIKVSWKTFNSDAWQLTVKNKPNEYGRKWNLNPIPEVHSDSPVNIATILNLASANSLHGLWYYKAMLIKGDKVGCWLKVQRALMYSFESLSHAVVKINKDTRPVVVGNGEIDGGQGEGERNSGRWGERVRWNEGDGEERGWDGTKEGKGRRAIQSGERERACVCRLSIDPDLLSTLNTELVGVDISSVKSRSDSEERDPGPPSGSIMVTCGFSSSSGRQQGLQLGQ